MVDVTVDQKPTVKLPYDPNVIPKAVRDRAAQVDALYQQNSGGEQQQEPPGPGSAPDSPVEQAPTQEAGPDVPLPTPAPAPAEALPPPEDENSNTWKSRFLTTQGRLEAANRTLGELQEQYYNEVARQPARQQRPRVAPPAPVKSFLTPEDESNYGRELLDVAQRAALQAVQPRFQEVEQQNAELRRQVAQERRRALDTAVELAVPDFRQIDQNPRWHRWLLGIDILSGRVRQQLLDEAVSAGSAPRVISFFRSFQNEEAATGHIETAPTQPVVPSTPRAAAVPLSSLAAPGRGRPASGGDIPAPPDKPFYTRPQIKLLYEQHRRGAYVGREAEWARLDADIIAAGREGRIR